MKLSPLIFKLTIVFSFLILTFSDLFGQCSLREIKLDERVNKSSLIVEGIVVGHRSLWDNLHHHIYTIHTVDVTRIFKGELLNPTIEILTNGGIVGYEMEKVSNLLELEDGQAGVFTLISTNKPVNTIGLLYEAYASTQGFINYDKSSKKANGVFDHYQNIENHLYTEVEKHTNISPKRIKEINWNKVGENGNFNHSSDLHLEQSDNLIMGDTLSAVSSEPILSTATISSFSPTTVQGGLKVQLTINGTGFGATQGSSYVQFPDANSGGSSWFTPLSTQYVSWSDTKIVVEVPSRAGTGQIRVTDGTNTVTGTGTLTVDYSLINLSYDISNGVSPSTSTYPFLAKLTNNNSNGGYTFQPYTTFASNINASTDFTNILSQWKCLTGVNWNVGATTTTNTTASDGINVVRFDIGSELSAGVLGVATSYFAGCSSSGTFAWYVKEVDVTVDDGTNFAYGSSTPTFSQYDFYSVILHEMGHTQQLAHVIDGTKVMHYALANGQQKRTPAATEVTGGTYSITNSALSGNCSTSPILPYSCNPPTVTLTASPTSISETGGSSTIKATLSGVYASDVTVNLSLSGTATVTSDYTLGTSITIPAGSLSSSITLSSVSDTKYEGNETVIADISSVTNGTELGTQQVTVTIVDDDTAPLVTLSTGAASIAETSGTTTVTATLTAASGLATTVTLGLTGTATVTTDYTLATTITIPAGNTSASITLSSVSDLLYEGNETVIIDITGVTNGTESGTQQKTVTITDDDTAPTVTLSTGAASIAETGGSTIVTATLSAASGLATTITLGLTGTATVTSDYTLAATITIPAGSTSASNTLASVSDAVYEGNETVIIDITGVTNGTESGTQQKTVTITDDDTAPTVTLTTGAASIAEAGGSTTVTATLSAASGLATTVTLGLTGTATVTTDYTLATTITIPAGNTSASITLASVSDLLYEGNETVIIDITGVTNGTESGTQQETVTITDDDAAPTVTLSTGTASIAETGGSATVTATLSAASGLATTVTLGLTGTATVASDYTLATTITIPAGSTSASNTLASVSDLLYEGNEMVIIDITGVTNGTESGTQQKTVTITDDDTAPTVTLTTGAASVAETGGSTTVTATLSAASGLATTVTLGLTGTATVTSDYTLATTITIPAGSTSASVTLASVSDVLYEGNETVIIDITGVSNGTESGTQQVMVSIIDDDSAPVVSLSAGGPVTIPETGGSTIVTATLSAVSGLTTTVSLALSGTTTLNADYTLATTITIPAGSTTGSITLASVSDVLFEGNENVMVDISSVTNGTENGTQQVTFTIADDDPAPFVTLSTGTTSIGESGGTTTATATLSAISGLPTTVTLTLTGTATGNVDYTMPTTITIPAGSASAFVPLASVNDALREGNETIIIDISNVTNGLESGTQQITVTIIDDDMPEIDLYQGANAIASSGTYDFGTVTLGNSSAVNFTIKNSGNYSLTIGSITLSGNNSSDFSIVQPANTVVPPGTNITFTVNFIPGCGSSKSALILISNDDSNENPYLINLIGTVTENVLPVPNLSSLPDLTAECSLTVTAPTATDNCSGTVTATTTDPTSYSNQGSYVITWLYTDAADNSTVQTQNVTISDVTVPTISCPTDMTVQSATDVIVNYSVPVGLDNCNGSSTLMTTGLASGSLFPVGKTTVTYKVTDIGNHAATCSFNVTVTGQSTGISNKVILTDEIYPNPTNGVLYVDLIKKTQSIEILDNYGAVIKLISDPQYSNQIDLSNLSDGLYFVRIITDSGFDLKKINLSK
jgi:hypothetical protein